MILILIIPVIMGLLGAGLFTVLALRDKSEISSNSKYKQHGKNNFSRQ